MNRTFKYQWLIEREKIRTCPHENCREGRIDGYRWTFSPITNKNNFLPKFVFDEMKGVPSRFNSDEDYLKCSCAALSMFKTLDAAKSRYNGMPNRVKLLLGYTNVASGQIDENVGVWNQENKSEHFDLFEYEGVDLTKTFKIVDSLYNGNA